jgi:hypothetical protein
MSYGRTVLVAAKQPGTRFWMEVYDVRHCSLGNTAHIASCATASGSNTLLAAAVAATAGQLHRHFNLASVPHLRH